MGYSSDVTDGQWTVVSRLLPARNRLARPRKGALRDIWKCDPVYRGIGLRAVASTKGLSACFNGALLFSSLAR